MHFQREARFQHSPGGVLGRIDGHDVTLKRETDHAVDVTVTRSRRLRSPTEIIEVVMSFRGSATTIRVDRGCSKIWGKEV